MNNKNNILVCGSIVYDRIMDFPGKFSEHILPDKTHILNVSFALNGVKESFGGTGGNIAYNLALLGERPRLVGAVGSDFGVYAKWLKKNKVDLDNIKTIKTASTASAYIMTDRADNQITGFYAGPLDKLGASLFNKREVSTLAIISPDLVARMLNYVSVFIRAKLPYIFDPGQQITSLSAAELRRAINGAEMLIGNDYEIQLILNKLKIKLAELEKMAGILVITKGGKGSEIYFKGKKIKISPVKPKKVLDPTGAGDAYRAGFIKGLAMNWPLEKCGKLASVTAVYAVENYGTQAHKFSWKDIKKRYEKNYKEKI